MLSHALGPNLADMAIDLLLPLVLALTLQEPPDGASAATNPQREEAPADYCPPPCETTAEDGPGPWEITAALGLALSAGNARTLNLNWNLLLDYRTSAWDWSVETDGLFVDADVPEEGYQELSLIYSVETRLEKRFTPVLGAYGLLDALVDHPSAIELRFDGEAGGAFTLVDREGNAMQNWLLRFDLGLLYSDENRREYYAGMRDLEDVVLVAPSLRLALKGPVGDHARFYEVAQIVPELGGSSRVRFASKSTFAVFVTKHLALDAHLGVDFDNDRAVGKEDTDVVLTFGAEYDL